MAENPLNQQLPDNADTGANTDSVSEDTVTDLEATGFNRLCVLQANCRKSHEKVTMRLFGAAGLRDTGHSGAQYQPYTEGMNDNIFNKLQEGDSTSS